MQLWILVPCKSLHSNNTRIRSVFVEVGQMTLGLVYLVVG